MIDRIRSLYPHLRVCAYALEAGGPVSVEVFTPDGTRFQKTAPTAAEAFIAILGPLPEDNPAEEIEDREPTPVADPFG